MISKDDLKNRVSIEPLYKGGANFETHVLAKTNYGYKFKPSIGNALFVAVFCAVGYGFFAAGIYKFSKTSSFDFITSNPVLIIAGSVFFLAANLLLYMHFKPIIFNKTKNIFYSGYKKEYSKKNTQLSKIVALQIIGETIRGENGGYKSFEINLVLDDASRLHVIDHGKLKSIIDDAEVLSKFLNIPIWHAESNKT